MLDSQLSTAEAATIGGMVGAMFGAIIIFCIIFYILSVIANWRIFVKAGEPGWKSLIPIYNYYIAFKIVKMKTWFWYLICVEILGYLLCLLNGFNPYAMTAEEVNNYNLFSNPGAAISILFVMIVNLIATIIYCTRMAKAFKKSPAFAIGLFFLPGIFLLVLGFDKSKYDRKAIRA